MIHDGHQVGSERLGARFADGRSFAAIAEHGEEVGRVLAPGVGGDGREPAPCARVCGDEYGEGADQPGRLLVHLVRHRGHHGTQRGHSVLERERRAEVGQARERSLAPFREGTSERGGVGVDGRRIAHGPKKPSRRLGEGRARGKALDVLAGDDEATRGAVDERSTGLGDEDAFQAFLHAGDVHGAHALYPGPAVTLNNVDSPIHEAGAADPDRLVPTREAARILGVRVETLYAYVSRGLLESFGGARSRGRRFRAGDLERLRARSQARAGHTAVAAGALRFGEPVLDSAITAIDARGPLYRGHAAVDLARRGMTFESVAELLFTGALPDAPPSWPMRAPPTHMPRGESGTPLALARAVVDVGLGDTERHDATRAADLDRARALIPWLASAIGAAPLEGPAPNGVAARAAHALGLRPSPRVCGAIDSMLVLLADHELNASSFAARVAAGTGADLYACLAAALATASGPLHGGAADRVEALLRGIGDPSRVATEIEARTRRGEGVPGFGHPLYPNGDPRAAPLLARAEALAPRARLVRVGLALARRMKRSRGEHATVDLGLVVLAAALGAPRGAAASLFVLGRTAGWVAHVLEQREARFLLRPRARYVGPPPLP